MSSVSFSVPGVPAPQGSKTRTKWGMREDNPATRPWRQAVAFEAEAAMDGCPLFLGPCSLEVRCFFPRPQSHFRSGKFAAELKPGAPEFQASTPDADKCLRAICDALKGYVVRDDAQFSRQLVEKRYGQPRAEILVSTIE